MKQTIEKFGFLTYAFTKENDKWFFWWELLESYKNDEDYNILKEKITNLYDKLNENDKDWLSKDVEKEIYFMI